MERVDDKLGTFYSQLFRGRAKGRLRMPAARLLVACLAAFGSLHAIAQESPKADLDATNSVPAPAPANEEIARWVEELGHDSFAVRQGAASRLLAAGMPARQPLQAIVDGPDPETRAAARRLIALIDQSEFHRRLEAFAADTDGKQGQTLPGWEQYQKLVGSDSAARALFVDMQRQEGAFIAAAFGASKRSPSELLEARLTRLNQWQSVANDRVASPPLASCAAMLFLGSVSELDVAESTALQIEGLLQRQPILEALRSDKPQEAVRRLVVGWVLHCPTKNEDILRRRLFVISNAGLAEALPLALAVAAGDSPYQRVQPTTRAVAALIVGQLGGAEHIDRVEPLLDDATTCFGPQMQIQGQLAGAVQVRDVGLIVLLQLTDQRPSDYGYVNARLVQPLKIYQLATLFRENDRQRIESIAKWRQWRADQKKAAAISAKSN